MRGKISSSGSNLTERLEDLLTSEVFSRLRYLPLADGLVPILNRIQNSYTATFIDQIDADTTEVASYEFWPRIDNVEPDLLIKVPLTLGRQLIVMVECKHKSGKAMRKLKDDEEVDELDLAKCDQLVKEYLIVEKLKIQVNPILLYITGHSSLPEKDFKESASIYGKLSGKNKKSFYESVYWIGWADIWSVFRSLYQQQNNPTSKLIIEDIMGLLSYHGYRAFQRFSASNLKIPEYDRPIWYRGRS